MAPPVVVVAVASGPALVVSEKPKFCCWCWFCCKLATKGLLVPVPVPVAAADEERKGDDEDAGVAATIEKEDANEFFGVQIGLSPSSGLLLLAGRGT
jgi:hypothetical protein